MTRREKDVDAMRACNLFLGLTACIHELSLEQIIAIGEATIDFIEKKVASQPSVLPIESRSERAVIDLSDPEVERTFDYHGT